MYSDLGDMIIPKYPQPKGKMKTEKFLKSVNAASALLKEGKVFTVEDPIPEQVRTSCIYYLCSALAFTIKVPVDRCVCGNR